MGLALLGLGDKPTIGLLYVAEGFVLTFFSNLTEYHTGTMPTQINDIGVTEI